MFLIDSIKSNFKFLLNNLKFSKNKKALAGWDYIIALLIMLFLIIGVITISAKARAIAIESLKWFVTC